MCQFKKKEMHSKDTNVAEYGGHIYEVVYNWQHVLNVGSLIDLIVL